MNKRTSLILSLFVLSSLVACNNSNSSTSKESTSTTNISSSVSSSSTTIDSTVISSSSSTSSTSTSSSSSSSSSTSTSSSSSEIISTGPTVLDDVIYRLEQAIQNQDKITKGTLTYNDGYNVNVSDYEYGIDSYGDFVHIYEQKSKTNKYYGYNASNEVYGLQESNGKISTPIGAINENCLNGPYISPYGNSDSDKMYGTAHTMQVILDLIKENKNQDFTNNSNSIDGYNFSFGKVVVGTRPYLYVNNVSFEVENDTFKQIDITIEKYSSVVADYENEGVYYLKDNAKPSLTMSASYTLEIGDRDASNPHNIEDYYYTSFDLLDEDNNVIGDTLNMNVDTPKDYKLTNIIPSTSLNTIDSIKVRGANGKITGTFSNTNNELTLMAKEEGEFEIEVYTKKFTKTIKVTVGKAIPVSVNTYYYTLQGDSFSIDLISQEKNVIDTYVNSEIYLKAAFSPSKADQSYTIDVFGDNKDKLTYEETEIVTNVSQDIRNTVYKFKALEVGTYNLRFTSLLDPSIYIDMEYIAQEIPSVESLLANRYVRNSKGKIYTDISFEPSAADPKVGIVSVSDSYGNSEDNGFYNYTYNETTKDFTLVKLDDNLNVKEGFETMVKMNFDENYNLIFTNRKSSSALNVYSNELMISRIEWNGRDSEGAWYSFSFNEDGTGHFGYSKSNENYEVVASYSCDITYTTYSEGDNVVIELDSASIEQIKKSKIITSISTIVGDTTFSSFTFTATTNKKQEEITLHQGG